MLAFRTIDIATEWELRKRFVRDAMMVSFGHLEHMTETEEWERIWLEGLIARDPSSCVHAWRDDAIVGELVMTLRPDALGYLFFIYVVPEHRGSDVADALHDYAVDYFRKHGCQVARLSASPTNVRANAFYARHGWRDLGPRPDAPHVNLRELRLVSA